MSVYLLSVFIPFINILSYKKSLKIFKGEIKSHINQKRKINAMVNRKKMRRQIVVGKIFYRKQRLRNMIPVTWDELGFSGRVSTSCSTSVICGVVVKWHEPGVLINTRGQNIQQYYMYTWRNEHIQWIVYCH